MAKQKNKVFKAAAYLLVLTLLISVFCTVFVACNRNNDGLEMFDYREKDGEIEIYGIKWKYTDGLTKLVIPDGVTSISSTLLWSMSDEKREKIESIVIPDSVTSIDSGTLEDTAWFKNQPDGVVYAGRVAYTYKGKGTTPESITLKEGAVSVSNNAFRFCESLVGITIPDTVKRIGEFAFVGCINLERLEISKNVINIELGAFGYCPKLKSITVSQDNPIYYISNGCLIDKQEKTILLGFDTEVIPSDGSVTKIGDAAFVYCDSLTAVTIPACITHIGSMAFLACESLTELTILNSSINIDAWAFSGCNLSDVNFNGTVEEWKVVKQESSILKFPKFSGEFTVHCTDGDFDKDGNEI
ncbi:MAG: leucine-rich repeat domain-containing protein [Clostridia bacterium]|nr:leucine-rich repeat domain-containing protein [Clostridia bacterium]